MRRGRDVMAVTGRTAAVLAANRPLGSPELSESRLLAAHGTWQRGREVRNLITARLEDLMPLLRRLAAKARRRRPRRRQNSKVSRHHGSSWKRST